MHIGLNLVYLVPGETGGMETYARELIPAMVAERPDLRFTAFVGREAAEAGDGPWKELIPSITVPVRARRRIEWVRGEQQLLPGLAAREGVGLLHSLASTAPARGRFRRVVTIHDLIYRIHPEAHFGLRSLGMRVLVPLAARRSHRIIAPSQSTKADLTRLLDVTSERVDVVPQGVTTPPDRSGPNKARARYGLGDRSMVLTVSAKRPHKNLPRLLDALALVPAPRRPILVVPGYPTPHEVELRRRADDLGLGNDVRFLGWTSAGELEDLYRAAAVFVYPSLYEGFGLPVLEAMVRGVPVACSDRASLTEVAGGAAAFFDPERPEMIADAIETLLSNRHEAEQLRRAGLEQASRFTWSATARATIQSYFSTCSPAAA